MLWRTTTSSSNFFRCEEAAFSARFCSSQSIAPPEALGKLKTSIFWDDSQLNICRFLGELSWHPMKLEFAFLDVLWDTLGTCRLRALTCSVRQTCDVVLRATVMPSLGISAPLPAVCQFGHSKNHCWAAQVCVFFGSQYSFAIGSVLSPSQTWDCGSVPTSASTQLQHVHSLCTSPWLLQKVAVNSSSTHNLGLAVSQSFSVVSVIQYA